MHTDENFNYEAAYESERAKRQALEQWCHRDIWFALWRIAVDFEPGLAAQSKPSTIIGVIRRIAEARSEAVQAREILREQVAILCGLEPTASFGQCVMAYRELLTQVSSQMANSPTQPPKVGIDFAPGKDRAVFSSLDDLGRMVGPERGRERHSEPPKTEPMHELPLDLQAEEQEENLGL